MLLEGAFVNRKVPRGAVSGSVKDGGLLRASARGLLTGSTNAWRMAPPRLRRTLAGAGQRAATGDRSDVGSRQRVTLARRPRQAGTRRNVHGTR